MDTLDLRYGHVDLYIGSAAPELPEIPSDTLAEDHFIQQVPRPAPAGLPAVSADSSGDQTR